MRSVIAILSLAVAVMIHAGATGAEAPVGKVAVAASGAVSFNGSPVTLEALKPKLVDLKRRSGVVWYYREPSGPEPQASASAVVKLIIEQRLPVSLSTTADYSDVVLPDGTTKPRPR
jgi:hypothetical protein